MALERRLIEIGPSIAAVAIAALWPISAYVLNPLLFPIALAAVGATWLILRRPEYGLALAVALTSMLGLELPGAGSGTVPVPSEPFRVLVPLLIFAVLAYSLLAGDLDRHELPGLTLGIGLLIGAALLSSLHALEPTRAVHDLLLTFTEAALFFAVAVVCRTWERLKVVVAGALVALLIASVQGIVQHYSGVFSAQGFAIAGEPVGRVQGSFAHPNEYASVLAVFLPLALAVAFTRAFSLPMRLLAGVASATGLLALEFSYARGTTAALVLGSVLWLLILRPRVAVRAIVIAAVAVILLAPSVVIERFSGGGGNPEDVSLRADTARSSLEITAAHPLLGVGLNNFSVAYDQQPFTTAGSRRLFHNEQVLTPDTAPVSYLNTLAEQGLVGLGASLVFFFLAVLTVYRTSRARDPAIAGIGIGVGMALTTFLFSLSLTAPEGLPLFAVLGLAAAAERLDVAGSRQVARRRPQKSRSPFPTSVPAPRAAR